MFRNRELFFIFSFLLCFFVVVGFSLFKLGDSVSFFYTPTTFFKRGDAGNVDLRIGGMVANDSVHKCGDGFNLCFTITDFNRDVSVRYTGTVLPPLFSPGKGIVAEGSYHDGAVYASRLFSRHDARYKPPGMTG